MKIAIQTTSLPLVKTGLLVVLVHEGKPLQDHLVIEINKSLGGIVERILKKEKFEGKWGQSKLVFTDGKMGATDVLIVGVGDKKKVDLEHLRKVGARAVKTAQSLKVATLTVAVSQEFGSFDIAECAQALAEGIKLGTYSFNRYKPKDKNAIEITDANFVTTSKLKDKVTKGANRGAALADGVMLARNLINTPANDMTPVALVNAAKNFKGVKTKIYSLSEIEKLKMGSYLGVAQGAANPPAFLEMHYKPKGKAKKVVCLIGKGVTFDSGGLSIKPAKSMETMKDDMSGAASVIGLMSVIHQLDPKVEVWGFVAAAENAVDAHAQRPGDIVTAMSGKTIEVLNTDAEGRLTLADACFYASKKKPDYMIDVATLTGACLVALGDRYSAILGNDEKLVKKVIESGKKCGEKIWEMPLVEEYREELKSPIADLKNIGGPYGGTINGALFIQEFIGDTKWAHLDIAGPSWTERPYDYETRGGTGVMVRTFAEFLHSLG